MSSSDTPEPLIVLKPCPFCGGPGHLSRFSDPPRGRGWHVVCHGEKYCPMYCSEPYSDLLDKAEATAKWNTRANPEAAATIVRLAEALEFYADARNWVAGGHGDNAYAALISDQGKQAREALASLHPVYEKGGE